jgi:2-dehydropantoate 2-reductase
VHAAGGPKALAGDTDAIRDMIRRMRQNLEALPMRPVPRGFNVLRILPEGVLVPVFRRFLRSPLAAPLGTTSPAASAELDRLAQQMGAFARAR